MIERPCAISAVTSPDSSPSKEWQEWWTNENDEASPHMTVANFMRYRQMCMEDTDFDARHLSWAQMHTARSGLKYSTMFNGYRESVNFGGNKKRYDAYENVDTHPSEITVFIPVSMNEPIENIARTLELVRLQCENDDFYADVFLCVNYKHPFTLEQVEHMDAAVYRPESVESVKEYVSFFIQIEDLMDEYEARPTHPIRLQLMTDSFASDENFNSIRSWYMLEYLMDYAIPRQVPKDHAIMWLDADTPMIGRGAIRKGIDAVKNKQAHYIKLFLQLVGDGTSHPIFSERDEAERVAGLYALLRRQLEDNLDPTDNRGYPDECGLVTMLENYYNVGGVATKDLAIGESRSLLERSRRVLDPNIPLLATLPDARLYNDYRRQVRLAGLGDPIDIPKREDGADYESDTEMRQRMPDTAKTPVTLAQITDMFAYMVDRQRGYNEADGIGRPVLTEGQVRRFAAVVLRFFPRFITAGQEGSAGIDVLASRLASAAV